ncbi:MAG: SDR family oxidoreductase [Bernardetiaceae bacterium]|nr:SDR family oxidoreductase [Bernardetiaceae bacterium]
MNFSNKNILIVGASSGVGYALAQQLEAAGANLFTASRTQPEGIKSTHFNLDVSDEAVADSLKNLPEVLHGVAYCPGTITLKPFQSLKDEHFMNDMQINTFGAVRVLKAAYKSLRKAKGASVVLFTTVASTVGMNFHASIATAKAALEGLGKSLAVEWASAEIRVNMIAPSLTDTPLAQNLLSSEDKREASAKRHPLARVGKPEDIAQAAAFLLSDQSSWITGQTIGVDGGMSTLRPI